MLSRDNFDFNDIVVAEVTPNGCNIFLSSMNDAADQHRLLRIPKYRCLASEPLKSGFYSYRDGVDGTSVLSVPCTLSLGYVSAYNALETTQQALLRALTGEQGFMGVGSVDAFCGLEDARY